MGSTNCAVPTLVPILCSSVNLILIDKYSPVVENGSSLLCQEKEMRPENIIPGLGLTTKEFKNVESYQKSRNSAVLTIMFTDIQGFTSLTEERGESYVHKLHIEHDKVIVDCVERGQAGIVIKYIGDSVMAVFSEPTAAVERALQIQKRLHEFNQEHPELEDLHVRIGLHMGQTVLESKMHVDLFGRHVNKASRIESLADGGHIYISYPVFDSVKSWLIEANHAAYKFHGQYLLKGIEKPEEIYEVYNTGLTKPKAPKGGKKKIITGQRLVVFTASFVVLLFVVFFVPGVRNLPMNKANDAVSPEPSGEEDVKQKSPGKPVAEPVISNTGEAPADTNQTAKTNPEQKVEDPEVFFISLNALEPVLDLETPLVLQQVEGSDTAKQSLVPISPGRHVVHFVVSGLVHYFYAFDVTPGKNFLPAKFVRSELPSTQVNLFLKDNDKLQDTRSSQQDYFYYTRGNLEKVSRSGRIDVTVTGQQVSPETARFSIEYSILIDDTEVSRDVLMVESPMNSNTSTRSDPIILFEDDYHAYHVRYSYRNDSIQVNIDAAFKDFSGTGL